ncbi:MAG: hypothetical protein GY927_21375 [bacterium]|nr:hypothetical protein [bacterium]
MMMFGSQAVIAAETPADVTEYCNKVYGSGTISGTDRRDNGPLCTKKKALSLTHHKVDPADICRSLHKTARYRREGPQIFCLADGETPARKNNVNLADYCRKNYGQSAIVSKRLTDNAPLCTVKGDSGLSQVHHAIDLAQLCGKGGAVSPGAVEGDVLDCARASAKADARTTRQLKEKLPSGTKRPTRKAVVPKTAIVSITDRPDLKGCGTFRYKELLELGYGKELPPKYDPKAIAQQLMQQYSTDAKMNWDALSLQEKDRYHYEKATRSYPWGWASGSVPSPCPGLSGGGFVPDLEEYCRTRYANPDPNYLFWLPNGRPVCHPTDWSSKAVSPSTLDAISTFTVGLYTACIEMYPDQAALRIRVLKEGEPNDKEVGTLYPILKFADRKVECYYLDVSTAISKPDETVEVES